MTIPACSSLLIFSVSEHRGPYRGRNRLLARACRTHATAAVELSLGVKRALSGVHSARQSLLSGDVEWPDDSASRGACCVDEWVDDGMASFLYVT